MEDEGNCLDFGGRLEGKRDGEPEEWAEIYHGAERKWSRIANKRPNIFFLWDSKSQIIPFVIDWFVPHPVPLSKSSHVSFLGLSIRPAPYIFFFLHFFYNWCKKQQSQNFKQWPNKSISIWMISFKNMFKIISF